MEPRKRIHPGVAAIIIIVLIGIVATTVIAINNANDTTSDETIQTSQSTNESSTNNTTNEASADAYRNGTYSATGEYVSPGGRESIGLTVIVENGIITDTQLEQNATDGEAREYQAAFASGYKQLVVGKSIDEVSLSRVAGSSLTSNGFNDALDQIKADAAA
jgi:cytoskeletal protein RodZ